MKLAEMQKMLRNFTLHSSRDALKATIDNRGSRTAFVICHGFGGSKDDVEEAAISEDIGKLGFTTLRITHKTGARHDLLFNQQPMQLADCVTLLASRSEVRRVHLIGTSIGGSNALLAGLRDCRVTSVCSIAAVSDGLRWLKERRGTTDFRKFIKKLDEAEMIRLESGRITLFSVRDVLKTGGTYFQSADLPPRSAPASSQVSAATWRELLLYKPIDTLKLPSSKPILFAHGLSDSLVSQSHTRRMLRVYKGKKKALMIKGGEHDMMAVTRIRKEVLFTYLGWLTELDQL